MARRRLTAEEQAESRRRRLEQKRNWYRKYRATEQGRAKEREYKRAMRANAGAYSTELASNPNYIAQERVTSKSMDAEISNTFSEGQICALSELDASTSPLNEPTLIPEQGTGRRSSRRAAQIAAEKIYNTSRNDTGSGVNVQNSSVATLNIPKSVATQPYQRRKQRLYHSIKLPPPNIDLVMECHEELLSAVQAEALLKAQFEYNMVMKTLRSLRASNVRIICPTIDDVPTIQSESQNAPSSVNRNKPNNSIKVTQVKSVSISVVPMELTAVVKSEPSMFTK